MAEPVTIGDINLSGRDLEVREAVEPLIAAGAWVEAVAILSARIKEIKKNRNTHVQALFLEWRDLPKEERPDFLTFAHHRRRPSIEGAAE